MMFFGLTLSSNTRDLENIKDQKLQAMFLSQVDIGFNQNASTIELSFTGNSKRNFKKVLDRVASSLEIINNEKNLEIQSKKARITKTKVEAAKRKLDIINKKIEEFIIAKNFPEEDSYTSGEYSEFFSLRRELISSRNKLEVEKTRLQFLNSSYQKIKNSHKIVIAK